VQIVVASTNPVKMNASLLGFQQMFPAQTWEVQGLSVPSLVRDQPLSDAETLLGATNRAHGARQARPTADFYVGIEGGVEQLADGTMSVAAWVVVLNRDGLHGKSETGTYFLPLEVSRLVESGLELGEADDRVFGGENTKQKNGSVGLLTGGCLRPPRLLHLSGHYGSTSPSRTHT
jgi:inosine/xanthosine triphosphatase